MQSGPDLHMFFKNKAKREQRPEQGGNTRVQAIRSALLPGHEPWSVGPLSSTLQMVTSPSLSHSWVRKTLLKNLRAKATEQEQRLLDDCVALLLLLPLQLITTMGSLCFCYTTQAALNTSLGSTVVSSLSNWNRAYNRSNKPHVNIFKETDNVILPVPPALQFLKSTELIQGHTGKECLLVVPEDSLEHRLKLTQIYWILLFVAAISLERDICGDEGGKEQIHLIQGIWGS